MSILKGSTHHLTQEERYQIYAYNKAGFTHQSIADELKRHISTIKRERGQLLAVGLVNIQDVAAAALFGLTSFVS